MIGNFVHLHLTPTDPDQDPKTKTFDLRLETGLMEMLMALHVLPVGVSVDYEVTNDGIPRKSWDKGAKAWVVRTKKDEEFLEPS